MYVCMYVCMQGKVRYIHYIFGTMSGSEGLVSSEVKQTIDPILTELVSFCKRGEKYSVIGLGFGVVVDLISISFSLFSQKEMKNEKMA